MAILALPQLFVKSNNSLFESTISMEEIINFHLKNNHKHAILTETQRLSHFPLFHYQASRNGLIPVLSLHYVWESASEWLLIPKNFEGYKFLLQFIAGDSLEESRWRNVVRIFISGDQDISPWKDQDFFISNSQSERGVYVRENIFLKKEDYPFFALVRAIKSETLYEKELKLNSHLKNSYLIQKNYDNKLWRKNLVNILQECGYYSLSYSKEREEIDDSKEREEIINYCQNKLAKLIMGLKENLSKKYLERLQREINLFDMKKYWNYCFVFYELMKFVQEEKILTSAGRGSACSSLIIFLLGITKVDPLKYDLLFDRFLNESSERIPDLDLDIEGSRKTEILIFLEKTFGKNRFVIPSIIKSIKNVNIISSVLERVLTAEEYKKSFLVKKLIGLPFMSQPHPSSLIYLPKNMKISDLCAKKVRDFIFPLSPFSYNSVGYLGLQKFDLLSSPYLDFISSLVKKIREIDQSFQLTEIPLDDLETYKMIGNSLTYGLFHLDSFAIKKVLENFKPQSIEELAQLIALIRPGINKHIPKFLNYSKVSKKIFFESSLQKIIEPTRTIILYQEQIMQLISSYVNISLADADRYRIALQIQNTAELKKLQLEFFNLAEKQGKQNSQVESVWKFIESFGAYSFNKSHAIAYALSAYQASYLKANFREIFYLESMRKHGLSETIFHELLIYGYKIFFPAKLENWNLYGNFDIKQKIFFIGLNCLTQNAEVVFKKLQEISPKLKEKTKHNLSSIIFILLSNGFNKEEIMSLNYLNAFKNYFCENQNALYLRFNWDCLLDKLIYGSLSNKEEKIFFTEEEERNYQVERQKNLNINLKKFKLN